jgi:hypothetical protein
MASPTFSSWSSPFGFRFTLTRVLVDLVTTAFNVSLSMSSFFPSVFFVRRLVFTAVFRSSRTLVRLTSFGFFTLLHIVATRFSFFFFFVFFFSSLAIMTGVISLSMAVPDVSRCLNAPRSAVNRTDCAQPAASPHIIRKKFPIVPYILYKNQKQQDMSLHSCMRVITRSQEQMSHQKRLLEKKISSSSLRFWSWSWLPFRESGTRNHGTRSTRRMCRNRKMGSGMTGDSRTKRGKLPARRGYRQVNNLICPRRIGQHSRRPWALRPETASILFVPRHYNSLHHTHT